MSENLQEYRVNIQEILSRTVTVLAKSEKDAVHIVEKQVNECEIILDEYDDWFGRNINIITDVT